MYDIFDLIVSNHGHFFVHANALILGYCVADTVDTAVFSSDIMAFHTSFGSIAFKIALLSESRHHEVVHSAMINSIIR